MELSRERKKSILSRKTLQTILFADRTVQSNSRFTRRGIFFTRKSRCIDRLTAASTRIKEKYEVRFLPSIEKKDVLI